MIFLNRRQVGQQLAKRLKRQKIFGKDVLVVSLPKGGVPVGDQIAKLLKIPHRVVVAKKIRAPDQPELAIGALSLSKDSLFLNRRLIRSLGISPAQLGQAITAAQKEIKKEKVIFGKKAAANLKDKVIIITDDGAATGATMIAAIKYIVDQDPDQTIVALPVSPPDTITKIKGLTDAVIVLQQPDNFISVSRFYQSFPQVSMEETKRMLGIKS